MNLTHRNQLPPSPPFEAWAVLDFWLRRWLWLAAWTVALAVAGGILARLAWKRSFTATAQLIHYAPSAVDDTFHPRDLATPSLVVMLQAPGLLAEVGAQLQPPLSARELADRLDITLDRNNDVATVTATAATRDEAADLVKRFCAIGIAYTGTIQRQEAIEAGDSVSHQLAEVEHEIETTRAAIPATSAATVTALAASSEEVAEPAPNDLSRRIQAAQEQLDDLLVRYTDAHPLVLEQRARLAALEDSERRTSAAAVTSPAAGTRPKVSPEISPAAFYGRVTPEEIAMGERLRSLETTRALFTERERAIQPFRDNPPGYFRVLRSSTENPILQHNHRLEVALCACLGAFFGLFGSASQVLLSEFLDNRIKSRADVRRVTGLPLLATLGDLKRLSPTAQDQWAFRAWTALQSQLSISPNHGMLCGVTSANRGDGRSTLIQLLSRAASACGFRVLTLTAGPASEMTAVPAIRDPRPVAAALPAGTSAAVGLTTSILSTPGQIVERLNRSDCPPVVDIPIPGWMWNLQRRKQWQAALDAWRTIENVVIFVELPPASAPESVLLAENIPNLLWLVDGDRSDASETIVDLETLRDAHCNLIGAVFNRERATPVRGRFSRWLGNAALILAAGLCLPAPKAAAQEAFSVTGPEQRAAWQQRLTLGPGDVLSLHLFGYPELTREEVPIGPDGRISYLEAENIPAAGLTVDEFRARLNEELGKYRRAPQAFVTPVAYRSKKYYMLGSVVQKGVFPLDRPITIIEAVARSRGFETAMSGGDTVEAVDFSRSFIGRAGKRMPVDFERLFLHGDLSQNIALEPDDYLYFPAAASGEIYVLGEVRLPGPVPFDSDTSTLSAIASRGGFTERAWKKRVLVIRGSLDHPEAFKVDVAGALDGQAPNLALQPGDMVYVSNRPWIKAEELLNSAASAFVESAVVTWTGLNVGPDIISRPKLSP